MQDLTLSNITFYETSKLLSSYLRKGWAVKKRTPLCISTTNVNTPSHGSEVDMKELSNDRKMEPRLTGV